MIEIRYLLDPSLLLTDVENVAELLRVIEYKVLDGSCAKLVADIIDSEPTLSTAKRLVVENRTALQDYVSEYLERSSEVAEAMEEQDIKKEDKIGMRFVDKLATIWRLKALGMAKMMTGIEEEITQQIKDYVALMLKHAESTAVDVDFCNITEKVLEEGCKTFTTSTTLLGLREAVADQMAKARLQGSKLYLKSKSVEFMKNKSPETFTSLAKALTESVGIGPGDDTTAVLQQVVVVLMEDIVKYFPAPSAHGENVPEILTLVCNQYLTADNVFVRIVLNIQDVVCIRMNCCMNFCMNVCKNFDNCPFPQPTSLD